MVGIGRYFLVFTIPIPKENSVSIFLVSKLWREPLKNMAGAPFFLRRGGLGPLFVHFALLLKKKGIPEVFFKKQADRGFARSRLCCTDADGTTNNSVSTILYTVYGMIHQKGGGTLRRLRMKIEREE